MIGADLQCRISFQSITYDSPRGGVSQITEKGDITVSFLLVQSARLSDSGEYMCQPSVGQPASTVLHVIRGQYMWQSYVGQPASTVLHVIRGQYMWQSYVDPRPLFSMLSEVSTCDSHM
jgi:hypothetical protein